MTPPFRAWVERQAVERPSAAALMWNGQWIDWQELHQCASALAQRLNARLGDGPRVIALLAAPSRRLVELVHAAQLANVTLVPLPPRASERELTRLLQHSQPVLLLHDAATRQLAERSATAAAVACLELEHDLDRVEPRRRLRTTVSAMHPLLIVYTSGTTGAPKGVTLRNAQLEAAAAAVLQRLGCSPGERWLAAMPMHHVGGMSILLRAAVGGLGVVLHPGFAADAVLRSLQQEDIAYVSLVPTMLSMLLEQAPEAVTPEGLRAAILGGGRLPAALVERAAARSWPLVATYGMSETAAQVTTSHAGDARSHPGSAGHPLVGVELHIDGAGGDGIGEILVRGPQVFDGYLGNPELSQQALRAGWLHTGDLGRVDDDGRLWVMTRRTDLIVTGGENVRPEEVEDVLLEHPAIADAGVFAVEDDHWGQRVAAAVVERDGGVSNDEIDAWCRARLAPFKVPRRIDRWPALPRNAAGKLERHGLRKAAPWPS